MKKYTYQEIQDTITIPLNYIYHISMCDWGVFIYIMEKKGSSFARLYWYHEDMSNVYLDSMSVNEEARRKGLGTKMQEIREKIGVQLGFSTSHLWVEKDSWMNEWYKRRGYKNGKIYKGEKNVTWMKKTL